MSNRILGIDLGTVNSCVAIVEGGRAIVLSDDSRRTIPSCLALQRDKELVGHVARRQEVSEPLSTVSSVKRILGHRFDSPEVQTMLERVPYTIKPSPVGSVLLEVGGRELTPVQISARILQRIREVAENALGEPVAKAVISVPAHFTDVQRKATKLAAEYAGIEVVRLINEPTAAAFAYGYRKGEDCKLAVYDLGGGTFDITVMTAQGDCFRVDGTDGDSFLGGEDVDRLLVDWLIEAFEREYGHDLRGNRVAALRLKEVAEKAKIDLSTVEETRIELPFLAQLDDGSRPLFSCTLTREKLEELARPLLDKTLELCERCLEAVGITRREIDTVLLVGGQSRMLMVRDAVREFFGKEPRRDIDPDEVVAMGAALYGYSLIADDLREEAEEAAGEAYAVAIRGTDVARRLVSGVEKLQGMPMGDNTLADKLEQLLAQTEEAGSLPEAEDDAPSAFQSGMHDERPEIVDVRPELLERLQNDLHALKQRSEDALDNMLEGLGDDDPEGAKMHSALEKAAARVTDFIGTAHESSEEAKDHLSDADHHREARKVDLIDVTSHPLGISTTEDLFSELIGQNVPIPVSKTRGFTTNQDGQAEVKISVHQGRDRRASKNQFLGDFILDKIPPAPRMHPKIDVAFSIDEDGILSVSARDANTGNEQSIRVDDPLQLREVEPEKLTPEVED